MAVYVKADGYSFIFFIFLSVLFCAIGGYLLASFLLKPLFETNRLLDELLKDTLHELNIPVATIKANIQMLKSTQKDHKNIKRLDRIKRASDDLLKLYSPLNYHIKREIQKIEKEEFNLKELIEEEVKKFKDIKNDVSIELFLDDVYIFADKDGFARVLDNLIENAIKYNKQDASVQIFLEENRLIIKDSGIGMNDDEIFRVFDRYYQGDHGKSGYGIGLSIVKSYCDEQKIAINIKSKKNQGTEIILNLSLVTS